MWNIHPEANAEFPWREDKDGVTRCVVLASLSNMFHESLFFIFVFLNPFFFTFPLLRHHALRHASTAFTNVTNGMGRTDDTRFDSWYGSRTAAVKNVSGYRSQRMSGPEVRRSVRKRSGSLGVHTNRNVSVSAYRPCALSTAWRVTWRGYRRTFVSGQSLSLGARLSRHSSATLKNNAGRGEIYVGGDVWLCPGSERARGNSLARCLTRIHCMAGCIAVFLIAAGTIRGPTILVLVGF